jgi:hypothetical protein
MNTIAPDDWLALARRQQARALAGDQQAASWCAKHAPALDAARGWRAYNELWSIYERLYRAYERLHHLWRGTDKLQSGRWQEGCAEHIAWSTKLHAQWSTPEAKADMEGCLGNVESWTPEHRADLDDSIVDLIERLAHSHGLDASKLQSMEQAKRLFDSFAGDSFEATCHELTAELSLIAGKEQANGTSNQNQLEAGHDRQSTRPAKATD